MMEIKTSRFGSLETITVADDAVLTFPEGIPGFEDYTDFALLEEEHYWPFAWLQSVAEPGIGFVLLDPRLICPGYQPDFQEQDLGCLNLRPTAHPELRCILVVPDNPLEATANLKAPLAINRERRRAKQIILTEERFRLRQPVFSQLPADPVLPAVQCSS